MIPEKQIFWHQGLFLQPQHFQHAERYTQSLLTPLNQYLRPFSWGVRRIEINESALLNRTVEITAFEGIFQDFSWIVGGQNGRLIARSFKDVENVFLEGDSFTVYIGLKRWDTLDINVKQIDSVDEPADVRYVSRQDLTEQKDLYDNGPPAQMRYMDHNLKIFWETEKETSGDYHLIPVLRLKMSGDVIQYDRSFIPPLVTIESSDGVIQLVKNIREQILARCRVLETYKPMHDSEVNSLEVSSLYYLMALRTLNKYVAVFQHHLQQPLLHPWQLYGILCEFAGELSTFSDRVNGLGYLRDGQQLISEYDHLDAGKSFSEIQKLIGELLDGVVIGSESILIMTREDDRFWCEIPADILRERQQYCLMVRTGHDGSEVINSMTHLVKTGSRAGMENLIVRSLTGVPLVYREIPPLGIARRQGCYCFELNTDCRQWDDVKQDESLCLYWDQAPEDAAMELVITRV